MNRTIEYIVECADPDCTTLVKTTSHKKRVLCPDCRREHQRLTSLRKRQRAMEEKNQEIYDPDLALEKKLDSAEYCIQYDASPEEESFPREARITTQELDLLLKNKHLPGGSLVCQLRTQSLYQVIYDSKFGKLILKFLLVVSLCCERAVFARLIESA